VILSWIATAVVVTAVLAGAAAWKLKPPEPRQVTRLYYELPKDQRFDAFFVNVLAISPDGRQLAYSTREGLYLRRMDKLDARFIPGTEGASCPFFSPDGKWLGYWLITDLKLRKIAIDGGAPVALTEAAAIGSFSWRADNTIVFSSGNSIMRVSADGGTPELIAKTAMAGEIIVHPKILPDEKSVLWTRAEPNPNKIMVQLLKSSERKELFAGNTAQYLPTGHIVYEADNSLLAIPFDLMALKVTTEPSFSLETPKTLFRGTYAARSGSNISWDISPDGKRFLMTKDAGTTGAGDSPRRINIVLNWFEELKQRMPAK
jgi:hypothetical protein